MNAKDDRPHAQLGYDVMAAAFEVYNHLGEGLSEEIYQVAFELELADRGIPFEAQPALPVYYKGRRMKKFLRPDLVVANDLVIELKAMKTLADEHQAQIINYLKVTRLTVGYLINFAAPARLQWKRFVHTQATS